MGNNFGAADDPATQRDILRTALAMVFEVTEGGTLVDYPTGWSAPFQFAPGGRVIAATA